MEWSKFTPAFLVGGVLLAVLFIFRKPSGGSIPTFETAGSGFGLDPGDPLPGLADIARRAGAGAYNANMDPGYLSAATANPLSQNPADPNVTDMPTDTTVNQGATSYPNIYSKIADAKKTADIAGSCCCAPPRCGGNSGPFNVPFIDSRGNGLAPEPSDVQWWGGVGYSIANPPTRPYPYWNGAYDGFPRSA